MANLLTFIRSASKPTERVERLIAFVDKVDDYADYIDLALNTEDQIALVLKRQDFDPDKKVNKINGLIDDFKELSGDIERYPLNAHLKNLGLEYSGFEDRQRSDGAITLFFKKLPTQNYKF